MYVCKKCGLPITVEVKTTPTRIEKRFFEHSIPKLIREIKSLNENLDKISEIDGQDKMQIDSLLNNINNHEFYNILGSEFFKTRLGYKFFDYIMPELTKEIKCLNENLNDRKGYYSKEEHLISKIIQEVAEDLENDNMRSLDFESLTEEFVVEFPFIINYTAKDWEDVFSKFIENSNIVIEVSSYDKEFALFEEKNTEEGITISLCDEYACQDIEDFIYFSEEEVDENIQKFFDFVSDLNKKSKKDIIKYINNEKDLNKRFLGYRLL